MAKPISIACARSVANISPHTKFPPVCMLSLRCRARPSRVKSGARPWLSEMIEPTEIETKLLDFVQHEVFAPDAGVTAETDLIGAGFDSMSLVRVLLFVETTYGFWLPQSEI